MAKKLRRFELYISTEIIAKNLKEAWKIFHRKIEIETTEITIITEHHRELKPYK